MDKTTKAVLKEMLQQLLDYQSSENCNDYSLPNTPDNLVFAQAVIEHDSFDTDDITVIGEKIWLSDFRITDYLIDLLTSDKED